MNRVFKLRPKQFYLSYSRAWLYYNNPQQYYLQYILGQKPKPTRNMLFGSIGHDALANRKYDYRSALRKAGFFAQQESALATALKNIPPVKTPEHEFVVTYSIGREKSILLYGFIDGIDGLKKNATLHEYKFVASSGTWNQDRVQSDFQLAFYSLAWKLMHARLPKECILHEINANTGTVSRYSFSPTQDTIRGAKNIIEYAYKGIKMEKYD